jgi:hypothetical protein
MVSLPDGTKVMAVQRKKLVSKIGFRSIYRHYHEEHHDGPLADCRESSDDSIEDDENEYCPHLNIMNKSIVVETHRRKRRRGGFTSNGGEEMGSRQKRTNHQNRTLALNSIYFQQLGTYHNNTAPPPVSSCSSSLVWHQHSRSSGKDTIRRMKFTTAKSIPLSRKSRTKSLS